MLEYVNNLAAAFCVVWRCEKIIDVSQETSYYNNLITKAQMQELQFHQRDHMLQFRNVPQMEKKRNETLILHASQNPERHQI